MSRFPSVLITPTYKGKPVMEQKLIQFQWAVGLPWRLIAWHKWEYCGSETIDVDGMTAVTDILGTVTKEFKKKTLRNGYQLCLDYEINFNEMSN